MPDIFVSKALQQKQTDEKVNRIKKLLNQEQKKTTSMNSKEQPDKPTKEVFTKEENTATLKKELKHKSSKQVLADIQEEIHSILKDKPKNGFFSTFLGKPHTIRFETQDKDEKVIALLRQHWVVNVPWIIIAILLVVLIPYLPKLPFFDFFPSSYKTVVQLLHVLLIMIYVTERLLKWFYNVYIITDERIVDVDFLSLLYKRISGCKIDKIQDVTYDMSGIFEAFFNFGNVRIQTAGEIPSFDFLAVPKPQEVVSLLNQLFLEEELEKLEGRIR